MRVLLTTLLIFSAFLPATAQQRTGKDYAYFFAVDNYDSRPEWSSLRNPVRDARALAGELKDMYGFETHVFENPDQATIDREIRKLRGKSFGPDDQLLLFFSGHGDFDDYRQRGYFLPAGGSDKFSLLDMRDVITPIGCEHILLLVDACYSGTIDEAIAYKGRGERPGITRATARQEMIDRKLRNRSRLLLTSGGKQRTPDGVDGSPFTIGVLTALRRGYGTGDGIVTYEDVLAALERVSPTPHNGEMPGHEQGSFVFVSTGRTPSTSEATTTTTITRPSSTSRPTPPSPEPVVDPAAAVLEDFYRAINGQDAWRNTRSYTLSRSLVLGNGLWATQTTSATSDGKIRNDVTLTATGLSRFFAYDGVTGRKVDQIAGYGNVEMMTPAESRNMQLNDPIPYYIDPLRRGYTVTKLSDQYLNGYNYRVLRFSKIGKYTAEVWFNAGTNLPAYEKLTDPLTGQVAQETQMSNYTWYGKILLPQTAFSTFPDGTTASGTITGFTQNPALRPGLFELR